MKLTILNCTILSIFVAFAASQAKADVYDTTYAWNGGSSIQPFGNSNTATYGQTFVAPTDNVLQNFTFYLNGAVGIHLDIEADVFAWSGNLDGGNPAQGATGPALYTSASFLFNGTGSFVPETIMTGGVTLTAGQHYVALFTISDGADYGNSNGTVVWGDIYPTHVAGDGGGGFNFDNNGSNYAAINGSPWDDGFDGGDSAWTATFTPAVPEPASLLLLGTVTVGLLSRLRRKTQQ